MTMFFPKCFLALFPPFLFLIYGCFSGHAITWPPPPPVPVIVMRNFQKWLQMVENCLNCDWQLAGLGQVDKADLRTALPCYFKTVMSSLHTERQKWGSPKGSFFISSVTYPSIWKEWKAEVRRWRERAKKQVGIMSAWKECGRFTHLYSYLPLPLHLELESNPSCAVKHRDPSGMKQTIQMHLLNIDGLLLRE